MRCPECGAVGYSRKTKTPEWRCRKCAHEWDEAWHNPYTELWNQEPRKNRFSWWSNPSRPPGTSWLSLVWPLKNLLQTIPGIAVWVWILAAITLITISCLTTPIGDWGKFWGSSGESQYDGAHGWEDLTR